MDQDAVAQIAKALGDPNRFCIFTQIAETGELFCGEIHAKSKISAATLSHHLKVLHELKLITSRKDGLNVFYRTVPETFEQYLRYLAGLGGRMKR